MFFCPSFRNQAFLLIVCFRTRDSNGSGEIAQEAHSKSAKGSELHSGGFLKLRNFFLIYFFNLTISITSRRWLSTSRRCHVLTSSHHNIQGTQKTQTSVTSRRWISTLQRWLPLFWTPLCNVATLAPTSRRQMSTLSRTSRRGISTSRH